MVSRIILVGFFLRLLIAVWNGFWGPSFGADFDASTFNLVAMEYSHHLELEEFQVGWIYSFLLGAVYRYTFESLFWGSLLSCFAWFWSAKILVRIFQLLRFSKDAKRQAMLIYALLPSSILFTSVTLREPYQLLFVNMAIYWSLRIQAGGGLMAWAALLFATTGMGILHGGMLLFGVALVIGTVCMIILRKGIPVYKVVPLVLVLVALVAAGAAVFGALSYDLSDGFAASVGAYQEGVLGAAGRTNYKQSVEISGPFDLVTFVPIALLQYWFEPMPWRVSSIADIPVLCENLLRAFLIWRAFVAVKSPENPARRQAIFFLILFFLIEQVWALGTINWGTAARHHIPAIGLILLVAFSWSRPEKNDSTRKAVPAVRP